MNVALWHKAIREAVWLLAACCLVLFCFQWLRVWIVGQFALEDVTFMLERFVQGKFFERLLPIPLAHMLSIDGRISIGYAEPLVIVVMCLWAIARGSAAVSGEIDAGTMEMLLAQPIRRGEILLSQAAVTTAGALLIALSAWAGTLVGIAVVDLESPANPARFGRAAANLFALAVFVAGVTTALSAADRYRRRTIGIAAGFCVVQQVIDIVARSVDDWEWLHWVTFLTLFNPPQLVVETQNPWLLFWHYNGLLLLLGLAGYAAAAVIFRRRDLPAPL